MNYFRYAKMNAAGKTPDNKRLVELNHDGGKVISIKLQNPE